MTRKVIYISKSKVGNPDDLMKVRHLLSQWNCEVTEFFGGTYTDKELKRSDIVIFLPASLDEPSTEGYYDVGKGQYTEARYAIHRMAWGDSYIVVGITANGMTLGILDGYRENENRNGWVSDFGAIRADEELHELEDFMEHYDISRLKVKKKPDDISSITGHERKVRLSTIKLMKP